MIKHIVMWKITDQDQAMTKTQLLVNMQQLLLTLPHAIDEIITFDVDINVISSPAHFDISLCSTFSSLEDLEAYQHHPKHIEVAEFIKRIAIQRAVIDAEIK